MEVTLQAQEFALRRALELEGLPFNESTLRRVVRVKYAVPPEALPVSRKYPLPEPKLPIFEPIVQGTFVLDQGQPNEKVLFYFQMPNIKDPLFRVWYPGEIEVTVDPNAETSVGMVPDYERQKRNLDTADRVINATFKFVEEVTGKSFPPGVVYFVGMHFKKGFLALDSRTWTGKVVDRIQEGIDRYIIKTNLADVEFLPDQPEEYAKGWHDRNPGLRRNDVVVLLGRWVQKHFIRVPGPKYVEASHPSAFSVRKDPESYISEIINLCK